MNALSLPGAPAWFDAILILSAQATLLAGIVWVILKLLGRWIPPSWRALLWFVVIARVLIPIAPPSAFSLQNIFVKATMAVPSPALSPRVEFPDDSREIDLQSIHNVNAMIFPETKTLPRKPFQKPINPSKALALIWASGAILFLTLLVGRSFMIRRRLIRHSFTSDSKILETINDCRDQLRLRFPIRIVVSDRIAAPALTGLIPARLILPTHFATGQFTPDQIRQILLHEFAHVRQGHLFLHWLTLIARCLQWFNPVIHFAASRLRHECELAADAAVLKNSTPEQRAAYGETILQVLAQSTSPSTVLALGMADQARHLKERLSALSNSNRRSYSAVGALICAAAVIIGLSGAEQANNDSPTKESGAKIRYYVRIAECPPEIIPRILESLGAPSTLTNQTRGINNFVLTPEQTKKLALIKEMQGVDFLEAPPHDLEIGSKADLRDFEEKDILTLTNIEVIVPSKDGSSLTNTEARVPFGPMLEVSSTKTTNKILRFDSTLTIQEFLGYSTNSEGKSGTKPLPTFRAFRKATTNNVEIGSSIAFYVPPRASMVPFAQNLPVLGDMPLLGRLFRSERANTNTPASLIFLTPGNPDKPLPASRARTLGRSTSVEAGLENRTGVDLVSAPPVAPISGRQSRINAENSSRNLLSTASQPSTNGLSRAENGFVPSPEIPPSALARQKLNQKIDSIRIDDFPLTTPVDLIEVVKELSFETRKLDPDHRGINFVLDKAKGRAANIDIELERFKIKIDPPIRDVTVRQLCDVIARVAAPPPGASGTATLAYSVEDYGVVFSVAIRDPETFASRSFRVSPNNFRSAMDAAYPLKNGEDRLTGAQRQLRDFLTAAGVDFVTNNVAVGGSVSKDFGVAPTGQPTKAAFYNDLTGTLFVRAPVSDLDTVEHAIHKLNMAPPQVCISTEIYELSKEEATQIQNDFQNPKALLATNEFLFGTKNETGQKGPTLAATKTIADNLKQPFIATNVLSPATQSILASDTVTTLRKRLRSGKDIDALTMPNVVTLLGREARISQEETSTIVTGSSTNIVGAMEALGWSVDLLPQSFDGHELQLSSFATRSEFLGYEKDGDIPLPRFRIRQTGSPVKLPPGDTQALLLPVTNMKRVPVLGDIPNLGRLFQNSEETKYSLILITSVFIDPAGNRISPNSN